MASLRLGPNVANAVTSRTLLEGGSHITRTRLMLSQNRISCFRLKAVPNPSYSDGTSSMSIEELQGALEQDPDSVDESWGNFFQSSIAKGTTIPGISSQVIQESMQIALLIEAYQLYGHLKANLDPLGLERRRIPDELDPAFYGFTEADLDRKFFLGNLKISRLWSESFPVQTLRSILTKLEITYCGSIGYEYMHIPDNDRRNWLRERIETTSPVEYNCQHHDVILERLIWSTQFEQFSSSKIPTAKRFGADGCEALIPAVDEILDKSAELGVESFVIGAYHRGRFNLMGNVFGKQFREIFSGLSVGVKPVDEDGYYEGSGDIMIMSGTSCDRTTRSGKEVHLSLVSMPSHLQAMGPVVVGKTRAKQYYSNDLDRTKIMGVVIHGDGGFAGQGVACETLHLGALQNYTSGGTIHFVICNQVSSTTRSKAGRSSLYSTDIAKTVNAPIVHVNGDDIEAVLHVCQLAVEWRQTFHSDFVVNIVGFRRFGHNELDDPFFTLPKFYEIVQNHPTVLDIYQEKLLKSGKVTKDDIDRIHNKVNSVLNEEFEASKDYTPEKRDSLTGSWSGFKSPIEFSHIRNTGVKLEILRNVGKAITNIPENFKAHSAITKVFADRVKMIETGKGIDWGLAEALAFATLLEEGYHVRLSGLDVERSSFLHRHAIIIDQETGEKHCPLRNVIADKKEDMFTVSNSPLSEYGVMGFEVGYSMENPNSLVLWEAQLGDFSNVAQVIIDQYLSCAEAKWLRQTGLVLLLPHAYEGYGPEHSNARLERFLEMSDDDPYVIPEMDPTLDTQIQQCNWQVVNVTTPANLFHVLRRQMHRDFRKPLIVMSPKKMFHHKDCKSNLSEFDDKQGIRFRRLIEDQNNHSDLEEGIKRLILCSGKVYYELDEARKKADRKDVAVCRVEQISPFPYDLVQRELKRYPNAEIVWCQEEPLNMGAYNYIAPRLFTAMKALGRGNFEDIKYVGRPPCAAAATGFLQVHIKEQAELLQKALQPDPITYPF